MFRVAEMIAWYGVFVISVTLHECCHAWAAKVGGDLTAFRGGQVSLDPRPHMRREPIGMIVLPIISLFLMGWPFGFASAPYDPYWAHRHPRKAAWMAFAGPAGNMILCISAFVVIKICLFAGVFVPPEYVSFGSLAQSANEGLGMGLALFLSVFFSMNLLLTVLNLIPLPPLDGSEVITLFMREETIQKYRELMKTPVFGIIGLMIAWRILNPLFDILFMWLINHVIYPGVGYS